MIHDPSSEFENIQHDAANPSKIVDRLMLMQAYETTLRNQGLLPVEDSQIYSLLTRVIDASEIENLPDQTNSQKVQLLREQLHHFRQSSGNALSKQISPIISHNTSTVFMKDLRVFESDSHNASHNIDKRTSNVPSEYHKRSNQSASNSIPMKMGDRGYGDIPRPKMLKNTKSGHSEQMLAYTGLDTIAHVSASASGQQTRNAVTQRTQIVYSGVGSEKIKPSNSTTNAISSNAITPPVNDGNFIFGGTKSSNVISKEDGTDSIPPLSKRITKRDSSVERLASELNVLQQLGQADEPHFVHEFSMTPNENTAHNFFTLAEHQNSLAKTQLLDKDFGKQFGKHMRTTPSTSSHQFIKTTPAISDLFVNTEEQNIQPNHQTSYLVTNKTIDLTEASANRSKTPVQPDVDRLYTTAYQGMNRQQSNLKNEDYMSFRQIQHSQNSKRSLVPPETTIVSRHRQVTENSIRINNEFFVHASSQSKQRKRSNSKGLNATGILSQTIYNGAINNTLIPFSDFHNQDTIPYLHVEVDQQQSPQTDRKDRRQIPQSKSTFKLVFHAFKALQAFAVARKRRRFLKNRLLHLIIQAISFHEQKLMNKVFKGFAQAKAYDKRVLQAFQQVRRSHISFTKRAYLRQMVSVRLSANLNRQLWQIAEAHYTRTLQISVLKSWRSVAHRLKKLERRLTSAWKKHPQRLMVFIVLVANSWKIDSDLFEFYSYATTNQKMRPGKKKKFQRIIEFALKSKLKMLFATWRTFSCSIKDFRARRRLNLKIQAFESFRKYTESQYRMRELLIKREDGLKRVAFAQLIINALNRQHLGKKAYLTKKLHADAQKKRFFDLWHELLKLCQGDAKAVASNSYKSLLCFKRKQWNLFVANMRQLLTIRKFKEIKLKQKALNSLKLYISRGNKLLRLRSKLERKHSMFIQKVYFRAVLRACLIQRRSETYRQYILLTRGFKGFQCAVHYRQLMDQLFLLALQQYSKKLQTRAFLALKHNRAARRNRAIKLLQAKAANKRLVMWQVVQLLRRTARHSREARRVKTEVNQYYAFQLIRKCLLSLRFFTQKMAYLKQAKQQVQQTRDRKAMKQVFSLFTNRGSKKIQLKSLQSKFAARRDTKVMDKCFSIWTHRYQELSSKINGCVRRCQLKLKSVLFASWVHLTAQSIFNFRQIKSHRRKYNLRTKKSCLHAWKVYSNDRYERKQMKVVSQFYFIKKVLTRVLYAWRQTTKADSMARINGDFKARSVLEECFLVLKKNYYSGQMLKNIVKSKQMYLLRKILQEWQDHAFTSRRSKDIIVYFQTRRKIENKMQCFRAIKESSKHDVFLRTTFRLRRLFDAWAWITERRRDLDVKGDQIQFVNQQLTKHIFLRRWRQNLFMSLALNKVAVPFSNTQRMKLAFSGLRSFAKKQKQVQQLRTQMLTSRAFLSLRRYTDLSTRTKALKQKVEGRLLSETLITLSAYVMTQQRFRRTTQLIKDRQELRLKEDFLHHWVQLAAEQRLVPIQQEVELAVRGKWLCKLCFASLKRYVQIRRGKHQMYLSLTNYYNELLLERTFKKLINYTDYRTLQKTLKIRADKNFKRIFINRWITVLNNHDSDYTVEYEVADNFYIINLMKRSINAWLSFLNNSRDTHVMKDQASLFDSIRLKIKAMRALAVARYIPDAPDEVIHEQERFCKRPHVVVDLRSRSQRALLVSAATNLPQLGMNAHLRFIKSTFKLVQQTSETKAPHMKFKKVQERISKVNKAIKKVNMKKVQYRNITKELVSVLCAPFFKLSNYDYIQEELQDSAHEQYEGQTSHSSEPEIVNVRHTSIEDSIYCGLTRSGLMIDGDLENSLIQAEKMLAESSFRNMQPDSFRNSMFLQDSAAAKNEGIYIVERLVGNDANKFSFRNNDRYHQSPDDSGSDDYDNYGLDIENLADEFATTHEDAPIRVSLQPQLKKDLSFDEISYKKGIISPESFEQRVSLKNNKVLENIRQNLNYLNF